MTKKCTEMVLKSEAATPAAELPHNRYHRAARSSAAMAIVYAAMAGRELVEWKKKAGHGKWEAWLEANCEFCSMTAWRYMELAGKLKEQLSNLTRVLDLPQGDEKAAHARTLAALLDRPPSELLPAETEKLLESLREATKGETLRQLYFDFGLLTPPKALGGANELNAFLKKHYLAQLGYVGTPLRDLPKDVQAEWAKFLREKADPNNDAEEFMAKDTWKRMMRELREECLDTKSYALLPRAMLEEIHGTLIDIKRELSEALKK